MPIALNPIIGLIAIAVLFIILIVVLIKIRRKKPTKKENTLDPRWINDLVLALGGFDNIQKIDHANQRVRCTLSDIRKVSQPALETLKVPAVLTGKQLTLLIKGNPSWVVQEINTLRNEE
mgnify:CR=1 FL=1